MSEEGTTVVVVEGEQTATELPVSEPEAVIEPVADAAVEIAEIQAERDISIAEIAAETETVIVEAMTDERVQSLERELDVCRNTISTLTTDLEQSRAQTLSIQVELEAMRSPPSLPADESAVAMQVSPEEASPPAEPVKRPKPKVRWT